jgi:hypothetical protein
MCLGRTCLVQENVLGILNVQVTDRPCHFIYILVVIHKQAESPKSRMSARFQERLLPTAGDSSLHTALPWTTPCICLLPPHHNRHQWLFDASGFRKREFCACASSHLRRCRLSTKLCCTSYIRTLKKCRVLDGNVRLQVVCTYSQKCV